MLPISAAPDSVLPENRSAAIINAAKSEDGGRAAAALAHRSGASGSAASRPKAVLTNSARRFVRPRSICTTDFQVCGPAKRISVMRLKSE